MISQGHTQPALSVYLKEGPQMSTCIFLSSFPLTSSCFIPLVGLPTDNTPSLRLQSSLWEMYLVSQHGECSLFQGGRFNCRASLFQRKCLDWEGSAILEKCGLLKNEWHKPPAFCWQETQKEILWLLLK